MWRQALAGKTAWIREIRVFYEAKLFMNSHLNFLYQLIFMRHFVVEQKVQKISQGPLFIHINSLARTTTWIREIKFLF